MWGLFYCDLNGCSFSLLVNMSMILYLRCVACLTWFVNCLLKCSAFCLSVIAALLSKVMVMFGVCGGFLCARPFRVFQTVWVFALWSQLSVRCCFRSVCLWFCISLSMFAFCCVRSGSLGFCCLVVLSCFILFLMCSTDGSLCGVFSLSVCGVCLRRVWRWLVYLLRSVRFVVFLCLRVFVQFLVWILGNLLCCSLCRFCGVVELYILSSFCRLSGLAGDPSWVPALWPSQCFFAVCLLWLWCLVR